MAAKTGLLELAETYDLERAELAQFTAAGEYFFEQFGAALVPLCPHPLRLVALTHDLESLGDFAAPVPSPNLFVMGVAGEPQMAFRTDSAVARALVDAALGALDTSSGARNAASAELTPTEVRVLRHLLATVLGKVAALTMAALTGAGPLIPGVSQTCVVLRPDAFDTKEPMFSVTAQFAVKEQRGALGLSLPRALKARLAACPAASRGAAPQSIKMDDEAGEDRVRQALGSVALPLTAVLGTVVLPLAEVKALTTGSIIPLRRIERNVAPVELCADGQPLFAGTVAADRGWYRFVIQPWGSS